MRIRWQRAAGRPRLERVTLPWPTLPPAASPPLPLKPAPVAPGEPVPVAKAPPRLVAYYRQQAERARYAVSQTPGGPVATAGQVAQALEVAGISQHELAARLDISRSNVTETKRGRRRHPAVSAWALQQLEQHGLLVTTEEVAS